MKTLNSFKNLHAGKDIIVCGCGESLRDFVDHDRFITIGVNDVGRLFHPNYLVVVNPRHQFTGDRFRYVESSKSDYLFTQLDLGTHHPNVVKFRLGTYGGTDPSNPDVLHYTQNSPYVALCLAALMGARRIGLIGVDFTEHHFFAKTGTHVLANRLPKIDAEYRALREALERQGIQVFNLSKMSRLKAFPFLSLHEFANGASITSSVPHGSTNGHRRVFFVHYKFLSCGDVFTQGLQHASEDLGLTARHAYWDDNFLPEKVRQFGPDLLLVVHGRTFIKRWGDQFAGYNTAVWLLDEPYEVDDTARFSGHFRTVFLNDPNTLHRHTNAHYLPVCFDPHVHFQRDQQRDYDVGFVGGHNSNRQVLLAALERQGLLSYVVGGPWRDEGLNKKCISRNADPVQVADLYRRTRIVLNIFRDTHHFNHQSIPSFSLNPRIYEGLACGALVVSEHRPEIQKVFPEMPTYEGPSSLLETIRSLLSDKGKYESIRQSCCDRIGGHAYNDRLREILRIAMNGSLDGRTLKELPMELDLQNAAAGVAVGSIPRIDGWDDYGGIVGHDSDEVYVLRKDRDMRPGMEMGLVSKKSYSAVDLRFEVNIQADACFIAKIHQESRLDQLSNSYHLMCDGSTDYFARHNHVFRKFRLNRNSWERVRIVLRNGWISLYRDDALMFSINDRHLQSGFAFLGIKGGSALVRNVSIGEAETYADTGLHSGRVDGVGFVVLRSREMTEVPAISIVTTVYDRVGCLRECLKSVKRLNFHNYEHIVVADAPPGDVVEQLKEIVASEGTNRTIFCNLTERHNDWGITPASIGLHLSGGKYVCFLSDDNGYLPDHFDNLVPVLEKGRDLGFAYSSCLYAGHRILNHPRPAPGRIDLGQPLFRRQLFDEHLQGKLPFNMMAWDWHMIEAFMSKGIKWQHVNRPTFLFRLAACERRARA